MTDYSDLQRSLTWSEVNDCNSFQDGDKRKVKLYWEEVKNVEFDSEIDAEVWLHSYFMEMDEERQNNPDFDSEQFKKRKVALTTYEQWQKRRKVLTNEEYDKKQAEKLGISVEEYRKKIDEL